MTLIQVLGHADRMLDCYRNEISQVILLSRYSIVIITRQLFQQLQSRANHDTSRWQNACTRR